MSICSTTLSFFWGRNTTDFWTHRLSDPHMEVVEVRVASVGLPAVLAAVVVASEHSDGIQRVGFAVVVANPCSTPQSGETSVSYPAPALHPKWEWRMRGLVKVEKKERKRQKSVCRFKVRGGGRTGKRKNAVQRVIKGRQNDRKGEGGRRKEKGKA